METRNPCTNHAGYRGNTYTMRRRDVSEIFLYPHISHAHILSIRTQLHVFRWLITFIYMHFHHLHRFHSYFPSIHSYNNTTKRGGKIHEKMRQPIIISPSIFTHSTHSLASNTFHYYPSNRSAPYFSPHQSFSVI